MAEEASCREADRGDCGASPWGDCRPAFPPESQAPDPGFETRVLWDLTRPVDPAADESVRATLEAGGVEIGYFEPVGQELA